MRRRQKVVRSMNRNDPSRKKCACRLNEAKLANCNKTPLKPSRAQLRKETPRRRRESGRVTLWPDGERVILPFLLCTGLLKRVFEELAREELKCVDRSELKQPTPIYHMKTKSLFLSSLLILALSACRPPSPPTPEAAAPTNTAEPNPASPVPQASTNTPGQVPTTGEPTKPNP